MSVANSLPDEIISEILAPALRVSDDAFSTMYRRDQKDSPFMNFSESSSAYLVVCKNWLRVATPLLYNVVNVGSKAQAQALAATLTANPELGRFIKKLRVEGGFGILMHKILKNSPNITDIYISLDIPRPDNATGLCRGLPLLDPIRVILDIGPLSRQTPGPDWNAKALCETVAECLVAWKHMTQFQIPHGIHVPSIWESLRLAPALNTLVIWDPQEYLKTIPTYVRTVSANPTLECIRLLPRSNSSQREAFHNVLKADPIIQSLVAIEDESPSSSVADTVRSELAPFTYPATLAANPIQEDAIWSRILFFAMERGGYQAKYQIYHSSDSSVPTDVAPLLVCKMFARLGTPLFYANIRLSGANSFALKRHLKQHPSLGQHVQTLFLDDGYKPEDLRKLAEYTPGLKEVYAGPLAPALPWKTFEGFVELAGASLLRLHGVKIGKSSKKPGVSPQIFARFSEMQEFGWNSKTEFETSAQGIHLDAFSALVALSIGACANSFFSVLTRMNLPSLETVVFDSAAVDGAAKFFEKHGSKIKQLTLFENQIQSRQFAIWRNCPSLTTLVIAWDNDFPASASCVKTSKIHASLERIVFKCMSKYQGLAQPHEELLGQLMEKLCSTSSFPALREIEHPFCTWPVTGPEVSRSKWVEWAESLLERNVHLHGPDGVRWRPRLKFVKYSR